MYYTNIIKISELDTNKIHFKLNYDKAVEVKDKGNYFKINNCKPLVEIINVCKDRVFSDASRGSIKTFDRPKNISFNDY